MTCIHGVELIPLIPIITAVGFARRCGCHGRIIDFFGAVQPPPTY